MQVQGASQLSTRQAESKPRALKPWLGRATWEPGLAAPQELAKWTAEKLGAWNSTNSLHKRQVGELALQMTVGNLPPFCHNFVRLELSPANALVLMNL